jgi:hypothetical protein
MEEWLVNKLKLHEVKYNEPNFKNQLWVMQNGTDLVQQLFLLIDLRVLADLILMSVNHIIWLPKMPTFGCVTRAQMLESKD